MSRNSVLAVIFGTCLFVTLFFLCRVLFHSDHIIKESSELRLGTFLLWHCITIFMLGLLYVLPEGDIINWLLIQCLMGSVLFSLTQLSIVQQFEPIKLVKINKWKDYQLQGPQLAFYNFYVLAYFYSVTGVVITGLYLIIMKCCQYLLERTLIEQLNLNLENISNEQILILQQNQQSCPICLTLFQIPGSYVQLGHGHIKHDRVVRLFCRHFFHYSCLEEWYKLNRNCPVCRTNIIVNNFDEVY